MEKVYILVNNKYLEIVLVNLLEIIGYLPIKLNEENLKIKKTKNIEKIIFTNYYYIQRNIKFLEIFNNIIVFVPYGATFIDTEIQSTKNIIYFSDTLTVSNMQRLLKSIII